MRTSIPTASYKNRIATLDSALGQIDLVGKSGELIQSWRIVTPKCSLGSSPDCSVVLEDPSISPHHANLIFGKRHTLLRAVSPVRIGGRNVREWLIDSSTEIQVGALRLVIHPTIGVIATVVHAEKLIEQAARLCKQLPMDIPVDGPERPKDWNSLLQNATATQDCLASSVANLSDLIIQSEWETPVSYSDLDPSLSQLSLFQTANVIAPTVDASLLEHATEAALPNLKQIPALKSGELEAIEKLLVTLQSSLERVHETIAHESKQSSDSIATSVLHEFDTFGRTWFSKLHDQISVQSTSQLAQFSDLQQQLEVRFDSIDGQLMMASNCDAQQSIALSEMLDLARAEKENIETQIDRVIQHREELSEAFLVLRNEIAVAIRSSQPHGPSVGCNDDSRALPTVNPNTVNPNTVNPNTVNSTLSVQDADLAESLERAQLQLLKYNQQVRELEAERDSAIIRIEQLSIPLPNHAEPHSPAALEPEPQDHWPLIETEYDPLDSQRLYEATSQVTSDEAHFFIESDEHLASPMVSDVGYFSEEIVAIEPSLNEQAPILWEEVYAEPNAARTDDSTDSEYVSNSHWDVDFHSTNHVSDNDGLLATEQENVTPRSDQGPTSFEEIEGSSAVVPLQVPMPYMTPRRAGGNIELPPQTEHEADDTTDEDVVQLPSWFTVDEHQFPAVPQSSMPASDLEDIEIVDNTEGDVVSDGMFARPDLSLYSDATLNSNDLESSDSLTVNIQPENDESLETDSQSISIRLQRMLEDADHRRGGGINAPSEPISSHRWSQSFSNPKAKASEPANSSDGAAIQDAVSNETIPSDSLLDRAIADVPSFADVDRTEDLSTDLSARSIDELPSENDQSSSEYSTVVDSHASFLRKQDLVVEESFPSNSDAISSEEESIEDYMQRLLQRVRTGQENISVAVPVQSSSSITRTRTPSTNVTPSAEASEEGPVHSNHSEKLKRERPITSELFVPRPQAPELRNELDALRELANSNARRAINRSDTRRTNSAFMFKLAITGTAVFSASSLFMLNGFQLNMPFAGMISAIVVALLWGYDCLNHFTQPKQNKHDSVIPPAEPTAPVAPIAEPMDSTEDRWRPSPA